MVNFLYTTYNYIQLCGVIPNYTEESFKRQSEEKIAFQAPLPIVNLFFIGNLK